MTSGSADLSVDLGNGALKLDNPVIAASGTFGYGIEYAPFVDLNRLGAFATKGLSLKPKIGNPVPRIVETPSGMLNAIGLENIGLDRFIEEKLPQLSPYSTRVLVNFFGDTVDEYCELASALNRADGIHALEMNISCPNVEKGGTQFSSDPEVVLSLLKAVRQATKRFLIVKLSPNVTDIKEIARAAEEGGADALSLINTHVGMAVDLKNAAPYLANRTGGLSGPAIKPIALNMVYQTVRAVNIPVIGIGGIASTEDALEFLSVGAAAVQIGTANFIDPSVTMKILDGLQAHFREKGLQSMEQIRLKE